MMGNPSKGENPTKNLSLIMSNKYKMNQREDEPSLLTEIYGIPSYLSTNQLEGNFSNALLEDRCLLHICQDENVTISIESIQIYSLKIYIRTLIRFLPRNPN